MWFENKHDYGYVSDDASFTSNRQNLKNALTDAQKEDKGFYQLKQRSSYNGKNLTIPVYASGQTGSTIRNAITGERSYNLKVGSYAEDLFFSSLVSSGHSSLVKLGRRDPIVLFFDNPEQYERHMHTKVSNEVKSHWYKRYNQAKEYYEI
jgi:hypothetical protein